MQDRNAQALAAIQTAKHQNLSYFAAVQSLKAQGFDQQTIDNVSDEFDYQSGALRSAPDQTQGDTPEEHEAEKEKLDEELAAEDEQLQQDLDNERREFRGGLHRGF